jgi:hypothetical protein
MKVNVSSKCVADSAPDISGDRFLLLNEKGPGLVLFVCTWAQDECTAEPRLAQPHA